MILERQIQHVRPGKWAELEAINQKYNVLEKKLGFPPKRRYRCYVGGKHNNVLALEREWESMAQMEAVHMASFADPGLQALGVEINAIIERVEVELYMALGE